MFISEKAFNGTNLRKVALNEGILEIADYAFSNLGWLEAISLPSTLYKIGHRAFFGCNKLMDIICFASNPPSLIYDYQEYYGQPYNNFSDKTYNNASLIVPNGSSRYKTRSGWELFKFVLEMDLTDVRRIDTNKAMPDGRIYNVSGRENQSLRPGLNVIKQSDGTTKKVMK